MKKTGLVWFTTNLRMHDNKPLHEALKYSDEVIPVYCLDENHYKKKNFGFDKIGKFRGRFIMEALNDLDTNLRIAGAGLTLLKGCPEVEITKIAIAYNARVVYVQSEYAAEEIATQNRVELALNKVGISLIKLETGNLYDAADLPFKIDNVPDVFTNFRKLVENKATIAEPIPAPSTVSSPPIAPLQTPALSQLNLDDFTPDPRQVLPFYGGETSGLKRLNEYFFETRSVLTYKQTRNGLIGANYSSKFSAWLSQGCLSPRQIFAALKEFETEGTANESTYWIYFELLWRDYFRLVKRKYGSKMFWLSGIKTKTILQPKHNKVLVNRWIKGETGNDFIDANMLELLHTGFMSNRGRQNVASYFCHDLKMDWRIGAAYFEQQLIDYDVCSNWGNWAYIAGVGTDPRPNRYFNIEKQANDYDADKTYRKLWKTLI